MEDWGWFKRLRYGTVQAIGLGFVAGAVETVGLAASLKLPLSILDFVAMGVAAVLLMGGVGALAGLMAGIVVIPDARKEQTTAPLVARQLAGAGALLCGWYLWQGAIDVWLRGQPIGAAAMAVMPLGFGGVIYFNARFWLRKTELGKGPNVGFLPVALAAAVLVVGGGALFYPSRDTGGTYALEGDPNVVLITVDRLGAGDWDAVPALGRLAGDGVRFEQAVTSSTASGPANATVLTGLHPLRHKMLYDGDPMDRFRTVATSVEVEGYATGAFVSSSLVGAGTGLDRGFRVFDDDTFGIVPGVARINLVDRVRQGLRLLRGEPEARRSPEGTVGRFEIWYARHRDLPHLAWVHLQVPVAGGSPDVGAVSDGLTRILDAIDDAGRGGDTLVVVAGTYGRPDGKRFLTDAEVLVPLVFRAPGAEVSEPVVGHQVRLMDIAATVMDFVNLDTLGETEGVTLLEYASGRRQASMTAGIVGRDDAGNPILGMRNNGLKWVRDADDGDHLFNLKEDPGETVDLVEEQPKTVRSARTMMSPEIVRFRTLVELR